MIKIIPIILLLTFSCSSDVQKINYEEEAIKFIEFTVMKNDVDISKVPSFLKAIQDHNKLTDQLEKYYGQNLSTWFIGAQGELGRFDKYKINIFNGKPSHLIGFRYELYEKRFYKNKSVFVKEDIVNMSLLSENLLMMELENKDIKSLKITLLFSFNENKKIKNVSIPLKSFDEEHATQDAFKIYDGTERRLYYRERAITPATEK